MSTYSTNLKVQLIGTGEENGTWGDVTNNAFNNVFEQAIVGYGTVTMSDSTTILTLANGNTSQTARNLYLNVTSSVSLSTTRDVIIPSITAGSTPIQKLYIVKNATTGSQSIRIIGATGTGITIPNGSTVMVYSNGTDVVDVMTYFSSLTLGSLTLSTPLAVSSGGTGSSSTTFVNLASNVTGTLPVANGGTGSSSTTYCNLTSNVTGTLPVANGGTGVVTLTGLAKGNGTSAFSAAVAGTDYVLPSAATTYSALQTFNGSSSALAALFKSTSEVVTTSATAASGTITLDALTQPVLFYTTNSSNNWTINVRGSGSATFNSVTSTGSSTTLVFMATNGSPAYYQTGFQIDGTPVVPKWQNASTPASGNANSIDVYTFNIIKTGSATYTVLAAQTRFA